MEGCVCFCVFHFFFPSSVLVVSYHVRLFRRERGDGRSLLVMNYISASFCPPCLCMGLLLLLLCCCCCCLWYLCMSSGFWLGGVAMYLSFYCSGRFVFAPICVWVPPLFSDLWLIEPSTQQQSTLFFLEETSCDDNNFYWYNTATHLTQTQHQYLASQVFSPRPPSVCSLLCRWIYFHLGCVSGKRVVSEPSFFQVSDLFTD